MAPLAAVGLLAALTIAPVGVAANDTDDPCPAPDADEVRTVTLEGELRGDGEVNTLERTVALVADDRERCRAVDDLDADALPVVAAVLHRDAQGTPVEAGGLGGAEAPVTTRVTVRDTTAVDRELTVTGPAGETRIEQRLGVPQLVRTTIRYPAGWQVSPATTDAGVAATGDATEVRRTALLFPPITSGESVLEVAATPDRGTPTVTVDATPVTDPEAVALAGELGERDAVAVLAALSELGADGGEELAEGTDQLADGTSELATGLDELAGGTRELADGLLEASAGTAELVAAGRQLDGGAGELAAGTRELAAGAGELAAGSGELAGGARELAAGIGELDAGVRELAAGLGPLAAGTQEVATGTSVLAQELGGAATGADQLAAGSRELAGGTRELADGIDEVRVGVTGPLREPATIDDATAQALVAGLLELVTAGLPDEVREQLPPADQLPVDADLLAGLLPDLSPVADELDVALGQLAGGVGDLADGADELAAGQAELADGLGEATAGADELADGAGQVADGVGEVAAGAGALPAATGALAAGSRELAGGAEELAAGTRDLATGTGELAEGSAGLASGLSGFVAGLKKLAGGTDEAAAGVGSLADGAHDAAEGADELATGAGELADGAGELPTALREAVGVADRAGQRDAEDAALITAGRQLADDLRGDGSYAVRLVAAGDDPLPLTALALAGLAAVAAAAGGRWWWLRRRPA